MLPAVWASALTLKLFRRINPSVGGKQLPRSKKCLLNVGIYPIRDHYYEPMFNPKHLRKPLSDERLLPGISWNVAEQLEMLKSFHFQNEFADMPAAFVGDTTFHFQNGAYGPGDAEFWYNIIRLKQPKRIIEIGSGNSTKMARLAIAANQKDDKSYQCRHICIEPYEMPWLEKIGVEVLRKKVEDVGLDFFEQLEANDILFIDSSHVIRPQGDVLFEYLEVLPRLKRGVIVHIHDIFSPRDYLKEWVVDDIRLWNEQYLLEAFLSFNSEWKIIGALNFLCHNHFELLREKCPRLTTPNSEPGSFYLARV
jgi:predicted O-methyltransferase YrrM